jgi:hypothetical protein
MVSVAGKSRSPYAGAVIRDGTMTMPLRPFGRRRETGHSARLAAHRALYEAALAVEDAAVPPRVRIETRAIPQGGALAARLLRDQLIAEHRAIVVEASGLFRPDHRDT